MSYSTKHALALELKELMKTKSIEHITVSELVDSCKITRQTFYYHFKDIYDLLTWVYEDDFLQHIKSQVDDTNWQESFLVILKYVYTHYAFCLNTLNSIQRNQFTYLFYQTIYDLLNSVFLRMAGADEVAIEDAHFIINFYCHAFSGTVIDWITSGIQSKPDELMNQLSWIMENQFRNAIHQAKTHQTESST